MEDQRVIIELTAEIVANYVANNNVTVNELPSLIQTVSQSLAGLGQPDVAVEPEMQSLTTGQIKKSIRPDGLVSFIDGRPYKTLKRHLSKHGMSVQDYKEKFGLPKDYPTTASDYSAKRSEMARSLGLGRQRNVEAAPSEPASDADVEVKPKAKRAPRAAKAAG